MADLKLGRIAFINVMPVYYALEHGLITHPFHLVYGHPAALNDLMQQGNLDISSCSCLEYARRWRNYYLARDLSIASYGPVQSVLLLSKRPPKDLANAEILATGQSHTSVILTKLLFKEYYKLPVSLQKGEVSATLAQNKLPEAILTIGDEALKLREHPSYPYVTDLAQAWHDWTKLPFVFALWIIKAEKIKNYQGDPTDLIRQSRDYGLAHLEEGIESVLSQSPLSKEELKYYYQKALKFSLGPEEIMGLKLFYQKITAAGFISEEPKLRFYEA